MNSVHPFYAIIPALIYIGVAYLLVWKEKKYIKYSVMIFLVLLRVSFFYVWLKKVNQLMNTENVGFSAYERFAQFVDISYFVVAIPISILFLWFISKIILKQELSPWFKGGLILLYTGVLGGVCILVQPVFDVLYYGLGPWS